MVILTSVQSGGPGLSVPGLPRPVTQEWEEPRADEWPLPIQVLPPYRR